MNQILLSIIIAAITAQGFKIIYNTYHKHSFQFQDLFETGGMPSSHTAAVTALTLSIYLIEGLSTAFLISLTLAIIVIRDAIGVRYSSGIQGELITKLLKKHKIKIKKAPHFALGHTPLQVLIGCVIGIVAALLPIIF